MADIQVDPKDGLAVQDLTTLDAAWLLDRERERERELDYNIMDLLVSKAMREAKTIIREREPNSEDRRKPEPLGPSKRASKQKGRRRSDR